MEHELKPCPFCDKAASMASAPPDAWWVVCDNNECCAEGPIRKVEADAVTAWNNRK